MTVMLIGTQRRLGFLVNCFSYKTSGSQPHLPSWVLDFSDLQGNDYFSECQTLKEYANVIVRDNKYRASANYAPSICFSRSSLKLDLEVIVFDKIVANTTRNSGSRFEYEEDNIECIRRVREWLRSAVRLLQISAQKKILPLDPRSGICRNNDLKMVLLPLLNDPIPLDPEEKEVLDLALDEINCRYDDEDLERLLQYHDTPVSLWSKIYDISADFIVFTTASSIAGVAAYDKRLRGRWDEPSRDQSACPDDVIAVPCGSSKPWILRKTRTQGRTQTNRKLRHTIYHVWRSDDTSRSWKNGSGTINACVKFEANALTWYGAECKTDVRLCHIQHGVVFIACMLQYIAKLV